ncbi:UNVERIFIED_CONTAM: hypothetical protein FKN15_017442 [Acipenser sinensis]
MIVCWQGIGVLVSVAILSVSTGPIVVQKKDNQSSNGVSDALNYALQSYNFMSKEQYLYKSLNFTLQTIQVMNGKEYVIDAEIGRTECLKGISAQYLSDCTLMQNSVSTGPIVVQKKDNQSSNGVSDALNYALQSYNFMSKEQYLYKSLNFTLQTIQVMNGKEYVIDAEIGRTECLKGISAQYLSDCTLMQNSVMFLLPSSFYQQTYWGFLLQCKFTS